MSSKNKPYMVFGMGAPGLFTCTVTVVGAPDWAAAGLAIKLLIARPNGRKEQ
ncbi:hypothetical protein GCM10011383_36940 [Hymenobacter cavernae]|uniref:Uncharacterized protein n=1 Tax=Hymenobacter cavernae TaxID=2044852 RepID=A0ABQ1ULX2_9BACT|nr:hypothetical protein GCM10011383_36940 [Hymenobacter cavernae]